MKRRDLVAANRATRTAEPVAGEPPVDQTRKPAELTEELRAA